MTDAKKTQSLRIRASRETHEMAAQAAAALKLDMSQLIRILLETYVEAQGQAAARGEFIPFPPAFKSARIQEGDSDAAPANISPSVAHAEVRERKRAG